MGDRVTAQQFFNNGAQAANDRTHPEYLQHAFQMFCSAVYADPTWATALYQAGNNASDLKHYHAAVACWRRALECDMPDVNDHSITDAARAKVLCNLGWRLETVGRTREALQCSLEATVLDPKLAFAWLNLSIVQGRLGATQESVNSARKRQMTGRTRNICNMRSKCSARRSTLTRHGRLRSIRPGITLLT